MATTPAQTIDTWLREPYTDAGWLSYTQDQTGTESQQHPGNGVSLSTADGLEAQRFSVAKTMKSYNPLGVNALCGSRVYSLTPNMRQAYAASVEGGAVIVGARDLDRDRLPLTDGDCA
jgi:redox-sensitive bicupin YhaK (pirin superfamily)